MICQEVYICSNNFAKNYKTTWQETDTCAGVVLAFIMIGFFLLL